MIPLSPETLQLKVSDDLHRALRLVDAMFVVGEVGLETDGILFALRKQLEETRRLADFPADAKMEVAS